MAKPGNDNPQEQPRQLPAILPMELLGIMQRSIFELNGYLSQPANVVDPQVILYRLERIAQWAMALPAQPQPPQQGVQQPPPQQTPGSKARLSS